MQANFSCSLSRALPPNFPQDPVAAAEYLERFKDSNKSSIDANSTMAKLRQLDTKPVKTVGDEDWSNILTWVKEEVHAQVLFALGDGDIQKGARTVGLSKDLVPNVIARKPPSDRVNRRLADVEGRSDFEAFATFCATTRRKN